MVNFVSVESHKKEVKLQNLLNTGAFIWFIWILFHFTIVFFFGLILDSLLLVGIFLAIGNAAALVVDIPVWVLQKYISPKRFLYLATTFMLIAIFIFLKFVYFQWIADFFLPVDPATVIEKSVSYLGAFFDSTLNIVLLIIASWLYGITKEAFSITTISYIFNNTTPSEYAKYLSRYNIYHGIWSFIWLIGSGILLALNIKFAIIVFIVLIALFYFFIMRFFDNEQDALDMETIKNLKNIKLESFKPDLGKEFQKITKTITTTTLWQIMEKTKVIFLKPTEIKKSINFVEVIKTTFDSFQSFYKMVSRQPISIILIRVMTLVMWFSFWDNFVSTFLIDFLQRLIDYNINEPLIRSTWWFITAYVLLGVLVIPAYLFQDIFIKLSNRFGQFNIVMFGSLISALSLILLGFFPKSIYITLTLAVINSIGYAAVFPISQAIFSERYNMLYAERYNLKQIDTTISAAPLMITLNIANVIGLLAWSIVLGTIWFKVFFVLFGLLLLWVFIYSIINYSTINWKSQEDSFPVDQQILTQIDTPPPPAIPPSSS